jgi:uracil-DNA glycosylase
MQASLFKEGSPEPNEAVDDVYREMLEKAEWLFPNKTFILGMGRPGAKVLLAGESPGPQDIETGKPFSGPAGELLMKMIASIGLSREECYFTNVVKYISQGDEITTKVLEFFTPYLHREIVAVGAKVVVTLGNSPTRALLGTKKPISELRGKFYDLEGTKLLATFNPAYLLRDPAKKREAWDDMKMLKEQLIGDSE